MLRHFLSDVIGSFNGRARVLWALPVYVLINACGGISLRSSMVVRSDFFPLSEVFHLHLDSGALLVLAA
jgi:hypothetical protein